MTIVLALGFCKLNSIQHTELLVAKLWSKVTHKHNEVFFFLPAIGVPFHVMIISRW